MHHLQEARRVPPLSPSHGSASYVSVLLTTGGVLAADQLTKLAVDPEWQGRGLGRILLDRVLDWARSHGAARIVLISNHRLSRALRIYETAGFVYGAVPAEIATKYKTADVFMSKDLGGKPDLAT